MSRALPFAVSIGRMASRGGVFLPRSWVRSAVRLLLVCAVLYVAPAPAAAHGQSPNCCFDLRIGPSGGEVAAAMVGVAAVVGVGTYFLARAPRTTGCVMEVGGALGLRGSGAGAPMYVLEGNTGGLHAGERVKVVGRKRGGANHQKVIRVSRVAKEYGACAAGMSP